MLFHRNFARAFIKVRSFIAYKIKIKQAVVFFVDMDLQILPHRYVLAYKRDGLKIAYGKAKFADLLCNMQKVLSLNPKVITKKKIK